MIAAPLAALLLIGLSACGGDQPAEPPPVQIIAARAIATTAAPEVRLVGSLAARRHIEILAEAGGPVEALRAVEGAKVVEGDLLFEIDARRQAAGLAEASAAAELADNELRRAEALAADGALTTAELERARAEAAARRADLERARVDLREARIRAPFAGTLGRRTVAVGQVVAPGTQLTTLTDLDTLEIEIGVPERYLAELAVGRPIEIRVAAFARPFTGAISFVSPLVDPASRNVTVVGRIGNEEGLLRPGMFAEARIPLKPREVIRVPASALEFRGQTVQVWVVDDEQRAAPQAVELAGRGDEYADVVGGLRAGAIVVREGQQKLRPGAKVSFPSPDAS